MSNKIDFATLTINSGVIPQATDTVIANTPGRWLVFAFCTTITPSDKGTPGFYMKLNGTIIRETYCGDITDQEWENLVLFDLVTLGPGDELSVFADKSSVNAARSKYIAIKI